MKMKIVVFDSGLGSLSIIKAIQKRTKADIIYLADKKNFPYGKKTKSQLYKIITDTIQKISERFNPDVIVLASNTPSLLFREKLPDNVITVLPPLEKIQKASNVAILTTEIVAKSKELENYISEFNNLEDVLKINCSELVELVENNSKVYETERDSGNFSVVNLSDGNGDIIETWNVSGVSKPTTSQLNSLDSSATTDFNNFKIRKTRKKSYGNIGDQLDEIYKDIDAWKARIKKIKDDNPKE